MTVSNGHVVTGYGPEVMDCLYDPEIDGVVWRGAFTPAARVSARRTITLLKAMPNAQAENVINLRDALKTGRPEARDFSENLELLTRFLSRITDLGQGTVRNKSRPEFRATRTPNGVWHIDPDKVTALGVPDGHGPEYLEQRLPGVFDRSGNFRPETPEDAERLAITLPNDALLIMKGIGDKPVPPYQARGLVHRRPNAKIELQRADRMVVQLSVSSIGF